MDTVHKIGNGPLIWATKGVEFGVPVACVAEPASPVGGLVEDAVGPV